MRSLGLLATAATIGLLACASAPAPQPDRDAANPDAPASAPLAVPGVLTASAPAPAAPSVATTGAYVCPMHPEVRSDAPDRCPKCGMKLVKEEAPDAGAARSHGDHP